MIKVSQTKFGGHGSPLEEQGNCFQACVASILEIPLEEAFDCRPYPDGTWFDKFNEWLKPYGLYCIAFDHTKEKPVTCTQVAGYAIMDCMSTTLYHGEHHVVVILNQKVVHDPNPHAGVQVGECQGFMLILPINPVAVQAPGK